MSRIRKYALWFFGGMLALSLFMLLRGYMRGEAEQEAFEMLKPPALPQEGDITGETSGSFSAKDELERSLAHYASLKEKNPDFAAWLMVSGTEIDYPVMYTPKEPEYYLRRAFDKSSSWSGTPFIGAGCDLESDCMIIYGHNMDNGTMFGTLDRYIEKNFWEKNPTLVLITPEEVREYEVFAAVRDRVLDKDESGFRYYNSGGELSEEGFDELKKWLGEKACYDTGISPEYGDQIVILSTCSYHTENGRFIIVARRSRG